MKIIVFGAKGFVGKALLKKLQNNGHDVKSLDTRTQSNLTHEVKNADAIVNLAGHSLFKNRWNDRIKSLIYDSRIESTKKIVQFIGLAHKEGQAPKVFISASAIGIYGSSSHETLAENAEIGSDFLAFVCRDWEEEAIKAQRLYGVRTVLLRTGVVLGKGGGALEKLLLPFKLFGGTLIGCGQQFMSWIHLDDEVGLIIHAIENENISGPLNAVAPKAVTNEEFSQTLAKVLGRPQAGLMGPRFFQQLIGIATKAGLYAGVGEAAEVIASGQHVIPEKALATGYKFQFNDIESALRKIVQ